MVAASRRLAALGWAIVPGGVKFEGVLGNHRYAHEDQALVNSDGRRFGAAGGVALGHDRGGVRSEDVLGNRRHTREDQALVNSDSRLRCGWQRCAGP